MNAEAVDTLEAPSRRAGRAAVGGAALLSAAALTDALLRGAGVVPVWDEETGAGAAKGAMDLVHAGAYVLLAVGLTAAGPGIDAGRSAVRLLRRLLVADLGALAAVFAVLAAVHLGGGTTSAALGAVAGVSFALVLLLPLVLGAVLVRRRGLRLPAAVLVGILPVLGLTLALAAADPAWAHPAYLEVTAYLGIALLAATASTPRVPADVDARVAS